jgi:hypothetical protein
MSRSHCTIFHSILPVTTGLELIMLHGSDDKRIVGISYKD